ncbi:MAG: DUF2007 domain-containing protein [Desulfobacterales bacterium]|nr:DUF2007 domain-containing protein [Desulfobacterales bacterium]
MSDNLKKIYTPNDNFEADLIRDALEQEDIYCFIQGYNHRSMLGVLGSYVGLGIMVPEEQAHKAKQIVEELLETVQALPPEVDDEDTKESFEPSKKFRPNSIRVAVILAFVIPGTGTCYAGNSNLGSWIVVSFFVCLTIFFLTMVSYNPSKFLFLSVPCIPLLMALDIFYAIKTLKSKNPNG